MLRDAAADIGRGVGIAVNRGRTMGLWEDRDGTVLPYVALMLAVIIGLAALAIDGSRLMSVQTQLQNAADALALAGAAELDRRPDSIIRAEAAIRGLIANPVTGAGPEKIAEVSGIDFLGSLPPSDDLPITTANLTDDPTLAAYVQVTVKPVAMLTIFPISVLAGRKSISVGAQSVAGYDQVLCNVTPLYVCNPFEASGMTYYQATQALVEASQDPGSRHRLIRLAGSQINGGAYGAGTVGYIAPDTGRLPVAACGPGARYGVPQGLAASEVRACFRLSAVNLLPSEDQPAMAGLNTRFDIYANGFDACRVYAPDQNVRKGYITVGNANWCSAVPGGPNWPMPTAQGAALPVDQNMIRANGTFDSSIALGNGVWNCVAYWSVAHAVGPGQNSPPPGCTTAATISRYNVYSYEMNFLGDRSLAAETGAPQCAPPGETGRRVVYAAVMNCGSSPVPMHADAQGVPVAAFGRFFLVLPANPGTNGNPYAEFLGLVKRSDPLSSDLVQLYR
jgi:Putative Flp pilus-assembly TadE/G-like